MWITRGEQGEVNDGDGVLWVKSEEFTGIGGEGVGGRDGDESRRFG